MTKSKIRDVITGERLGVRPDIYAKRIEEYGSEEALINQYVGRKTKQMLKTGMTVQEIRDSVKAPKNLPEISEDTLTEIKSRFGNAKPKARKASTKVNAEPEEEVDEDIRDFMQSGQEALATA